MVELDFSSTSAMPDDGVPDMTRLTILDEEVINKNLKVRYEKDRIYVGPYEFPARLNGQIYTNFLVDDLDMLLDNIPLQRLRNVDINNIWFQHDGCPAHFANVTRNHLDVRFPNAWIGRGGPRRWPPRSPDLTPLDFFLWGHVKNLVYRNMPENINVLRNRIQEAFASITAEMVSNARASLLRKAALCIQVEGKNFEHLL